MIHFQLLYQSIKLPMFFSSRNYGMYPKSTVAKFQRPYTLPRICFHIAGTAVTAHSHQCGPQSLQVTRLSLKQNYRGDAKHVAQITGESCFASTH
uniref:Uncharacterized protein n=1 Tax=Oryzias latipes TaxID=8090 RepID=A0A3P9KYI5_ORYLA